MRQRAKPPTLGDVARLADVSVPTASRILNGGVRGAASGSPELRQRVTEAALTLGYAVSAAAQTIKDGRARTVAMVVTDIDDFGSAAMISGVIHAAEERGLSVAVRETRDDPVREAEILLRLRGELHRAVLVATGRTLDPAREAALDNQLSVLEEQGSTVVIIGDSTLKYRRVTVDNLAGAYSLARYLAEGEAHQYAVLAGHADDITSRDRLEGFLAGLTDAGILIPRERIVHTELTRDGGSRGIAEIQALLPSLEVIACMSDAMAVGAIRELHERGVNVPEDLEVTGFDCIPLLRDVLPNFSTVEIPLRQFGPAALALALDDDRPDGHIALPATSIVRGRAISR